MRRQVRLTQLNSDHFNDLLIANPHFALMHTLLATSDSEDTPSPDTPSARVTPSADSPPSLSHAYLLQDFPVSPKSPPLPACSSSHSEDQRLQNIDYFQFYDEFWQMTKFEYDLQCISSSDLNSDSITRSEVESKF